jgi:hypothetical protein
MRGGVVTYYRLDETMLRIYRGLMRDDYSEIVHLDGDRTNNELDNICPVLHEEATGVVYDPNKEIWRAFTTSHSSDIGQHRRRVLGSFKTRNEAIAFKKSYDTIREN